MMRTMLPHMIILKLSSLIASSLLRNAVAELRNTVIIYSVYRSCALVEQLCTC